MLGRLTTWQVIVSAKASSSCRAQACLLARALFLLSFSAFAPALQKLSLSTRFRKLESTWKNKDTVKKRFASHLQSDKNTTVQLLAAFTFTSEVFDAMLCSTLKRPGHLFFLDYTLNLLQYDPLGVIAKTLQMCSSNSLEQFSSFLYILSITLCLKY